MIVTALRWELKWTHYRIVYTIYSVLSWEENKLVLFVSKNWRTTLEKTIGCRTVEKATELYANYGKKLQKYEKKILELWEKSWENNIQELIINCNPIKCPILELRKLWEKSWENNIQELIINCNPIKCQSYIYLIGHKIVFKIICSINNHILIIFCLWFRRFCLRYEHNWLDLLTSCFKSLAMTAFKIIMLVWLAYLTSKICWEKEMSVQTGLTADRQIVIAFLA